MNDLAKWEVRGQVHTLKVEFAEWDPGKEEWQPPRSFSVVRFLPNGNANGSESRDPDGSVSQSSHSYDGNGRRSELRFRINGAQVSDAIYSYDGSGRSVRIVSVNQDGTRRKSQADGRGPNGRSRKGSVIPRQAQDAEHASAMEGVEQVYGTRGARTIATFYDAGGRPDEVLVYDGKFRLLRRLILERDAAGRLVREEMRFGEQAQFPGAPTEFDSVPRKARDATAALLANLFGCSRVTRYVYDLKGRLVERRTRMGDLAGCLTTLGYDDHDNKIEEITEDASRDLQIDEEWNMQPAKERSYRRELRFEYTYDAQGNWTQRVAWIRLEDADFQRVKVERRQITYYRPANCTGVGGTHEEHPVPCEAPALARTQPISRRLVGSC